MNTSTLCKARSLSLLFLVLFTSILSFGQSFIHPGILNNEYELDYVKSKIKSGAQPWIQAYNSWSASTYASLTYKPSAVASMDCGSYNKDSLGNTVPACDNIVHDGMAAYSAALMWYFTENPAYATQSIKILNAWSSIYTSNSGSNADLVVSWSTPWLANAAEILKYGSPNGKTSGWSTADITMFENMLAKFLVYVKNESMPGNNWIQSAIEAHFAIAIFTNDRIEFNNAVSRWNQRVSTYIYETTDGSTPFVYPSGHLSLYSSAWYSQHTFINGLAMETCRDLGHLNLGICSMIFAAQSAFEQGVDLFVGQKKRLSDFFELHGSWMTGSVAVPATICSGTIVTGASSTTGIQPPNGGGGRAYEIAYNHLHSRLGITMPFTTQMLTKYRPAEIGDWVFTPETMTHANLPFNLGPTITEIDESQNKLEESIQLFPVPINNLLTIRSSKWITKVELFHLSGAKLQEINVESGSVTMSMSSYEIGQYLARIEFLDNVVFKRVVVVR